MRRRQPASVALRKNRNGLLEGSNFPSSHRGVYNFDYNDGSKLAVFCFWESGQRHISVIRISK